MRTESPVLRGESVEVEILKSWVLNRNLKAAWSKEYDLFGVCKDQRESYEKG
jgi:hypothetical protein